MWSPPGIGSDQEQDEEVLLPMAKRPRHRGGDRAGGSQDTVPPGRADDRQLIALEHMLEASGNSANRAASSAGRQKRMPAERIFAVPCDILRRVAPLVDVCGTMQEPVIFVKNVDGCHGRLVAGRTMDDLIDLGHEPPAPSRGQRGAISVEWHWKRESRTPWRTGLRTLSDLAEQLLEYLRMDPELSRIPALRQRRAWNDAEVLVTTPGCSLGRHTDAQPANCLLVIFCAGLSCRSQAWPAGRFVERVLESGDVMIFDGTRTAHAVPEVLRRKSGQPDCPWLAQRRLAVLVRQSEHR